MDFCGSPASLSDFSSSSSSPSFSLSPRLRRSRSSTSSQSSIDSHGVSAINLNSCDGLTIKVTPPTIKHICCIGAGYVGGPTSAVIALQNPHINVTVVDRDADRIARWNSRHLPVQEPGLYDVVRSARDGTKETVVHMQDKSGLATSLSARAPNLFFSTEIEKTIAEADLILLSVNTPTKTYGIGAGQATNMASIESATKLIAGCAKPGAIIVEKSTVPCRTAQMMEDTLQIHRPGVRFHILSNPEFLAEGTAIKDLLNPDRILIGSSQTPYGLAAAESLKAVYTAWVAPEKIINTNLWSSELAKLVANAMLAQRISSINTVSAICERTGADVDEVAAVIGQDQRLGSKFLKSGIGFGGSCFKKDILSLIYLAKSLDLPEVGDYWMQVLNINEWQRVRFVKKIIQRLNHTLSGKKIAILGYAFKKDTNDTRESPAIEVVRQLLADAPNEIAIFDPQCTPTQITREFATMCGADVLQTHGGPVTAYQDAYAACDKAAAIIVLTEWDQFRYPSLPIPQSAFHEGHKLVQDPFAHLREALSEKEVLTIRERRSHVTFLDRKTSYFDPLQRFNPEPKCLPGCSDCSEGRRKDYLSHTPIDWTAIAAQSERPRWVFDGRGILDVAGMKKLGFRVERVGRSSSSSLW